MHLTPNLTIILLQMIPFLVLVFALKTLVFNPLLDYLEERHRRIQGFSQDSQELGAEAEKGMREIEEQLTRARAEISDARSRTIQSALAEERRIVEEARARAEAQMSEFRAELSDARREASQALLSEVETLSRDIASRVLGRAIV